MVKLHVKVRNDSQFLYETSVKEETSKLIENLTNIYNGRLKVTRLCYELEELIKHGPFLPPNMQGLTDEQIDELHLVDEYADKCTTSEGYTFNKDPMGRRDGRQPNARIGAVLDKTRREALALISKDLVKEEVCLDMKMVCSAIEILRGAVMIAYPMGLPPYDPIRLELENNEDLSGTQSSLEVLDVQRTSLWFCGKEIKKEKILEEYLGKNEKSKAIVKLQKSGSGPPSREPAISAEEQKTLMMLAHRRQEELKKLEEDDDNSYHNSSWADMGGLHRSLHGINDVRFRPK